MPVPQWMGEFAKSYSPNMFADCSSRWLPRQGSRNKRRRQAVTYWFLISNFLYSLVPAAIVFGILWAFTGMSSFTSRLMQRQKSAVVEQLGTPDLASGPATGAAAGPPEASIIGLAASASSSPDDGPLLLAHELGEARSHQAADDFDSAARHSHRGCPRGHSLRHYDGNGICCSRCAGAFLLALQARTLN